MSIFSHFKDYSDCEPIGAALPEVIIDNKYYKELNIDKNISNSEFLRSLCRKGIQKKGIDKFENKKDYYNQVKYELEVFEETGLVDYILALWDICKFAKENSIAIGSGRGCLSGDSMIRTCDGLKPIRDIKVGDVVLNGFGEWSPVFNKFEYPCDEKLLEFSVQGSSYRKSRFTKDHKILVLKNPLGEFPVRRSGIKNYEEKFNNPKLEWIRADEVEAGDYFVRFYEPIKDNQIDKIDLSRWAKEFGEDYVTHIYPINTKNKLSVKSISAEIDVCSSSVARFKKRDYSPNNKKSYKKILDYFKNKEISIDDFRGFDPYVREKHSRYIDPVDFYYLIGFYIGDGCSRSSEITIALNSERDVKELKWFVWFCEKYKFPYSSDKQNGKNLIKFYIRSKPLQKCVNDFCSGSTSKSNKRIHFNASELNKECSLALFNGLLDSDGSDAEGRLQFDNTTEEFIETFRYLGEKILKTSSSVFKREADPEKKRNKDSYKCRLSKVGNCNSKMIKKEDYVLIRVNEIEEKNNDEKKVYDLSIGGKSPSYSTEDFSVHNSASSSTVLYLINVTGVDPIKNDLIFERFVSKTRVKKVGEVNGITYFDGALLADVDLDFDYARRGEAIDYIRTRYKGRVAKILTFNTFSSKLCIKEATKYFDGSSEEEAMAAADSILKKHGFVSSITESLEESDKFKKWAEGHEFCLKNARKIENLNKNTGQHPSGIAVCSQPIDNICPLQLSKEGDLVTGYEMGDVADLMVKFDILGLRTISIAKKTCDKLGISLEDIDDEDPFIYEILQDFRNPVGLFQISAETNFKVAQQVKPDSLRELSDVIGLARPGAIAFVGDYVKQKRELKKIGLNDKLDQILAQTKNILIYQESSMKIAFEVFGLSKSDAEDLRVIIGKKKRDQMPAWKEKIYQAAKKQNLPEEVADYFWNAMDASANYSFARAHACPYSSLSAKTLWLKFKYPREFFCSILEMSEDDPDPLQVIADVARELPDFGIKLLPPNLEESSMDFTIEGSNIRYGLSSIKGIAQSAKESLKEFTQLKPKNKYEVFNCAKQCGININVLTSLIYAGALGEEERSKKVLEAQAFNLLTDREKRNFLLLGEEYKYDLLNNIAEVVKSGRIADDGKALMKESRFETFKKKFEPHKKLFFENRKHEKLSIWWFEKTLLGYSFSIQLKDCFDESGDLKNLKEIEDDKSDSWRAVVQVDDFFVKISQNGNRYMRLEVSDDFGKANLIFCDSKKENKLTDFLDSVNLKKSNIVVVRAQRGNGTHFVDGIKLISDKVYTKVGQLK